MSGARSADLVSMLLPAELDLGLGRFAAGQRSGLYERHLRVESIPEPRNHRDLHATKMFAKRQ